MSLYAGENTLFGTLVEDDRFSRRRVFMSARTGNGAVAFAKSTLPRDLIENAYRVLNEEPGLPTPPVRPTQFVPRLASELGCPDPARRRAEQLAGRAVDAGVTAGMHPSGFAAACLYMVACAHAAPLTQADAAAAAEVTVRNQRDTLLSVVE